MKAATKKHAAAARSRGRTSTSAKSIAKRLSLTRTQKIIAGSVLTAVVVSVCGYFGWRAYANRPVDYASMLRQSPAYRAYQVGVAADAAGRQKEAEDAFQRALSQDPSNALLYNALATLYISQGEVQKALVTCENGVNRAPGSPDLYYTLGLARYQSGQLDGAAQVLVRSLAMKSDNADAHLWLGNIYLVQAKLSGLTPDGGDPALVGKAIDEFRRATAIGDDVAEYHSALAEGLFQRGDLAEARTEIERAVQLDATNAKYYRSLGKVCDRLNDLTAAADAFTKATQADKEDAESFYGLGTAFFKQQQDAQAVDAFRSALKINPFHGDAHEKLGQTLIRMGQQDEGQNELKLAEDSRTRAKTIVEMQRRSAGEPSNAELANNLGIELARQGDFDEAMQAFQRAIAANPAMIDARYQVAGLYAQRGNWIQALTAFMAVDKAKPGYRRTNYFLSKVNEKIGRKTEADKRMKMFEAQEKAGEVTDS